MSFAFLVAIGLAGWWLLQPARPGAIRVAEARRLLEVAADATPEAIGAAHRRLIARVQPDVGGTAELARRVNLARDVLLKEYRRLA